VRDSVSVGGAESAVGLDRQRRVTRMRLGRLSLAIDLTELVQPGSELSFGERAPARADGGLLGQSNGQKAKRASRAHVRAELLGLRFGRMAHLRGLNFADACQTFSFEAALAGVVPRAAEPWPRLDSSRKQAARPQRRRRLDVAILRSVALLRNPWRWRASVSREFREKSRRPEHQPERQGMCSRRRSAWARVPGSGKNERREERCEGVASFRGRTGMEGGVWSWGW
jgi:hypothetical protein